MSFPYTNVYDYLKQSGVLEQGTAQDIEKARKEYRKLYLKHYKSEYKKHHSNVTMSFRNEDKLELKKLSASKGKRLASYIKELALSSLHTKGNAHTTEKMIAIEQLFSSSYDIVEELQFENEYPEVCESLDKLLLLFKQIEKLFKMS